MTQMTAAYSRERPASWQRSRSSPRPRRPIANGCSTRSNSSTTRRHRAGADLVVSRAAFLCAPHGLAGINVIAWLARVVLQPLDVQRGDVGTRPHTRPLMRPVVAFEAIGSWLPFRAVRARSHLVERVTR